MNKVFKSNMFTDYITSDLKQFTRDQVNYLTRPLTLRQQASYSLEERLAMFKRRYPNSKVTVYKLRKLYKQYGIKKKVIRKAKLTTRP